MWPDPADTPTNIEYTKGTVRFDEAVGRRWRVPQLHRRRRRRSASSRAFGDEKYARLQALKTKWDPDNLFRHNQNIKPG